MIRTRRNLRPQKKKKKVVRDPVIKPSVEPERTEDNPAPPEKPKKTSRRLSILKVRNTKQKVESGIESPEPVKAKEKPVAPSDEDVSLLASLRYKMKNLTKRRKVSKPAPLESNDELPPESSNKKKVRKVPTRNPDRQPSEKESEHLSSAGEVDEEIVLHQYRDGQMTTTH